MMQGQLPDPRPWAAEMGSSTNLTSWWQRDLFRRYFEVDASSWSLMATSKYLLNSTSLADDSSPLPSPGTFAGSKPPKENVRVHQDASATFSPASRSSGKRASKSSKCGTSLQNANLRLFPAGRSGTSLASGLPALAINSSSPALTSSTKRRDGSASWMLTMRMATPDLVKLSLVRSMPFVKAFHPGSDRVPWLDAAIEAKGTRRLTGHGMSG